MTVLMPRRINEQLQAALTSAGRREIGGVLMGEHVEKEVFAICEVTVQRQNGTIASFLRLVTDVISPLKNFFAKTKHKYERFNYLGEWHSHPSFALSPSATDAEAMFEIVRDNEVGANFAVLMIVKLADGKLQGAVFVYTPERVVQGALRIEDSHGQEEENLPA